MKRTAPEILRAVIIVAAITGGLVLDQRLEFWGQPLTNLGVWGLFLFWLRQAPPDDQVALVACVVYAALGEIVLSLVWGLYEYRLGNIPLFVPPGHALMLMLGWSLARRMPEIAARTILGGAGAYTLLAAIAGLDTLAVPLYLMLAVSVLALPAHRRLFASSFILTLTLELYGTTLGNWYWHREVPWVGLVTTNPPAIAGAFYCTLHALAIAAVALLSAPRLARAAR